MVLGVTVLGPSDVAASDAPAIAPRKLTLTMQRPSSTSATQPAYGFALTEGNDRLPDAQVPVPGPTLVLRRGEPVEITLVNRLPEGTAIHWHGMELDSYYDGVHGWSGAGARVTPLIEPGGTFVVRFTPPRTGTFIYHTHLHDNRQLPAGLYGAMLVVDPSAPGDAYDAATDHVFVIGGGNFVIGGVNSAAAAPPLLNGERQPQFVWKAGTRHRVRLINITPDDIFSVSLQTTDGPVDLAPADQGRRAATSRPMRPRPRASDDRRRRNVRFRSPDAARTTDAVARCQDHGREVAGSRAGDCQVVVHKVQGGWSSVCVLTVQELFTAEFAENAEVP